MSRNPPRRAPSLAQRLAPWLAVCLSAGCSKLNASFAEENGAATTSDAGGETNPPPDPTVDPTTPPGTATTATTGDPPTTSPTVDPTRADSSTTGNEGAESSTGLGESSGGDPRCAESGVACNAFDGSDACKERGYECRPQGSGKDGYEQTACVMPLPPPKTDEAVCEIACHRFSGIDNCVGRQLCDPYQDPKTRECADLCAGTPGAPACPQNQTCLNYGDGDELQFGLCRQNCNPLDLACPNMVCAALGPAVGPLFACVPPVAGAGAEGEPCDGPGDCAGGLLCASCPGGLCCAQVCDTTLDEPPTQCSGTLDCTPFQDAGGHANVEENIGVCVEA